MNVLEWLFVVILSLCVAVFLWTAVMSVIDYRRNKAWREQVLRDALDDLEGHRTEAELPVRLDDGPLAPLDEEE